jgi:hypothetical protein
MADLLAIISHDRAQPVAADVLEAFGASYESLRGGGGHAQTVGTDWAKVKLIDPAAPPDIGIERAGEGWTAWAGALVDPAGAGTRPLEALDGQFAMVRLEENGTTLRVIADPLGMKPVFTAEASGATYISTSALVLAKHLRLPPSRDGVEAFLRTGNQFGRLTPWQGVARMLPAEALTMTPGGRERNAYWQPSIEAELRALPLEPCAEACVARASASIAARYGDGRPWMDLTGGFDTRLVALLAQGGGVTFETNTVGDEESEDVQIARQIAAAAGWPWTRIALPDNWAERLPAGVEEAVAWGDCHLDALGLAEVLFGHRRKAETETRLLTGGGGEHWRDHPWGHELLGAGRSSRFHFDRLIEWRLLSANDLSVFREDPTPSVRANLREELEARAAPFSACSNTFQGDVIYAFKSTGHFGAYQAAAGAWVHMEMPLYLRPAFEATVSSRPRNRNFHRLQREMMRQLDPALAALPTETGGPAEPLRIGNAHRFTAYPWRRGKRFASRLRGRVLGGRGDASPTSQEAARGELIGRLRGEGRLDPARMRSAQVYDPGRLAELLERAAARPAAVDWTTVGRLVTVELALEAVDAGLE